MTESTSSISGKRAVELALASYAILALPAALKTIGGYVLGREIGNRVIEVLYCWLTLAGNLWRTYGAIPFWASQFHAGQPIVGNPELSVLHPLSLLLYVLPAGAVLNLAMCVVPALAACLMFGYARALGISVLGSWLAGLVYGFHPHLAAQVYARGMMNFLFTYATIPLLLWGGYVALRSLAWRGAGLLGVGLGLTLLGSHVPLAALALVVLIGQSVALIIKDKGVSLRSLVILVTGFALGLGIALPHLVPLVHFWKHTANSVPIDSARDYAFSRLMPEHWVSLLFPRFFGDEVNSVYWGRLTYSPIIFYSGIATVVLWVVALLARKRWYVAGCATLGLAFSLFLSAEVLPVFGRLSVLPGWVQAAESPGIFIAMVPLFGALLAAIGWDSVVGLEVRTRRRLGQGLLLLVFAAAVIGWLFFARRGGEGAFWRELVSRLTNDPLTSLSPEMAQQLTKNEQFLEGCFVVAQDSVLRSLTYLAGFALVLVFGFSRHNRPRAAALGLLSMLMSADIVGFFHSQQSIYPEALLTLPKAIELELKRSCGSDYRTLAPLDPDLCALPLASEIGSAWQRTPFVYRNYHDLVRVQERQPTFYAPGLMMSRMTPLTRSLGVKKIMTRPMNVYRDPATTVTIQTSAAWLYETSGTVQPRVWMPEEVVVTTQSVVALVNVTSLEWQPEKTAYVERTTFVPELYDQSARTTASVTLETGQEVRITLAHETTSPCVVVMADTYDPWWKAWAGEKEIPIAQANYAFRAMILPAGTQDVRLRYEIPGWPWLARIAWFCAAVGAALVLLGGSARRDSSTVHDEGAPTR